MTEASTSHNLVGIDVTTDIAISVRLGLRTDRETFHLAAVSTFAYVGGPNRPVSVRG